MQARLCCCTWLCLLLLSDREQPFFFYLVTPQVLDPHQSLWIYSLMSCATGRNMLVHTPPQTQNTPPPKTRNFMDMVFLAERTHFSRRP